MKGVFALLGPNENTERRLLTEFALLNQGKNRTMSKKLFVGGLAWATDDSSLRAHFEQVGTVEEAKVITDRDSGRSRGFGFITFAEEDSASEAVSSLNGTELDGRTIRVDAATERGGGGRGGGGGGRGGFGGGGGGRGGGGGGGRGGYGGGGGGGGGGGRW